jgi:hypothetical protein
VTSCSPVRGETARAVTAARYADYKTCKKRGWRGVAAGKTVICRVRRENEQVVSASACVADSVSCVLSSDSTKCAGANNGLPTVLLPLINTAFHLRTRNFSLRGQWGADPDALYNLCSILKIMLQKLCCKHNITLPATAFMYTRI